MYSHINAINNCVFLISIVLFLRGMLLFLLLLLFNKIDKKKVINGVVLGFVFIAISFLSSEISEEYIISDISKILKEISDENNPSSIEISINGVDCEGNKIIFINDLLQMKEGKEKGYLNESNILVKIVVKKTDEINLEIIENLSKDHKYKVLFKDFSIKDSNSHRLITTTYISECLAEKAGEEKERTETGSETK